MNLLRGISLILFVVFALPLPLYASASHFSDEHSNSGHSGIPRINIVLTPRDGGIREVVPGKYRQRYEKWKAEFVSTKHGQRLWDAYANNSEFVLTIAVSGERKHGAGTDDFQWDESGHLVGATITLGAELHNGFPAPIYYPVLNSLSAYSNLPSANGRILAAAKISHEFGHVRQIGESSMAALQTQSRLIPAYISIFRKNGLKTNDARLIDIAKQMGGTPVEIWESREYWSEVNAMLFLYERIINEPFYCGVFGRIKRNLETYAPKYEPRFGSQPELTASPCPK